MAWLDRFEDFDNFGFDTGGTSFKPHSFRGNGSVPNAQNQHHAPRESTQVKQLREITSEITQITVIGVIIAKEQERSIFSKKNVGSERHLVSFTLRDSPSLFVNVTCWGNADFICDISNNFDVGSVVQLKNVQVQPKTANQSDDKFKPWTPVSYQLTVSENHSTVEAYTGWNAATYVNTLTIPTRPNNDYYTLEDINISGTELQGDHVNIMAAVKKVGQIRYLTTKAGKQTKKCDVILMDDTCSSFSLDLWQNHADATLLWTPFETVLFASDVKITYNSFKTSMVATADSKTIFTMNPDTPEACSLRQFLKTQDSSDIDMDDNFPVKEEDPDLSNITEVFTVQQLKQKRSSMAQDIRATTQYGLMCVMLTSFNLDTDDPGILHKVCGRCRRKLPVEECVECTNPECNTDYSSSATGSSNNAVTIYNLPVSLSDHTGTVDFCHLQQPVIKTITGCEPELFLMMPADERINIKWQYLLEQCKVIFKMRKFKQGSGQLPSVQILSLEKQTYI